MGGLGVRVVGGGRWGGWEGGRARGGRRQYMC